MKQAQHDEYPEFYAAYARVVPDGDLIASLRAAPYNPTALVHGNLTYISQDRGMMSGYQARTGKMVYDRQRLKDRRAFTSSPWAYDGKTYCLNEYDQACVIKAGRNVEVLYTNSLEEAELCMATPEIAGGKRIIRTQDRVYCIAKPE